MIYIVIFLLSILFLELAFLFKNKSIVLYKLCIVIAAVIPCLLAALRANSVGTDTYNYVNMFKLAGTTSNLSEYIIKIQNNYQISDIMFILTNYIIANITNSVEIELFVQETLIIIPIFIAIFMTSKNKSNVIFGVLIFYLFCFNLSLNMVRQSIALSFEVLAFAFLEKDNKKCFIIFTLIAVLFHNVTIIVYFIYLLYLFLKTNKIKDKIKALIIVLTIFAAIISVIYIKDILNIIYSINLISSKLFSYIDVFSNNDNKIGWLSSLVYLSILIIILFNKKNLSKKINNINFYFMLSVLSFVLLQTAVTISNANRVSYYFVWPCILLVLPQLAIKNGHYIKIRSLFYNLFIFFMFSFYWIWNYLIQNRAETLPYLIR